MLELLNHLAQVFPWDAAVYGPVIVPVLALIKKVADIKDGEVMVWLLIAASLVSGFVDYIMQTQPSDPRVIAFNAAIAGITSQPVYKLVLKPAMKFFSNQVEKAAQFNLEVKSAAMPAGGLPTASNPDVK